MILQPYIEPSGRKREFGLGEDAPADEQAEEDGENERDEGAIFENVDGYLVLRGCNGLWHSNIWELSGE